MGCARVLSLPISHCDVALVAAAHDGGQSFNQSSIAVLATGPPFVNVNVADCRPIPLVIVARAAADPSREVPSLS